MKEELIELQNKASAIAIKDVRLNRYDKLFPNETLYFLRAAVSIDQMQEHLRDVQVRMKNRLSKGSEIDLGAMENDLKYILLYFIEICDGLDLDFTEIISTAPNVE